METYLIPVQDKYLIYRPLRRLAFVGNRAMADLAMKIAALPPQSQVEGPKGALDFLAAVGYLQPDPPPPGPVDPTAPFRPTSAALLMTGRCNLRCIYCYASGGEKEDYDLPLATAQAVIDQVCRNAVDQGLAAFEVTFHGGGEPSLAWDTLQAAVAYARGKELGASLNMVSNGVWTASQCDWLIHHLDGLTISMDGDRPTQDAQRPFPTGRGSFDQVMRTLRELDQAGYPFRLRMTTTPERFTALPEDVAFLCRETGCRTIQVEPCFQSRRGGHPIPTADQADAFSQAFLAAYDLAQAAGRELFYSGARPWLLTGAFCTAPAGGSLTVNPRGEIVACYEITDADHRLARQSTFGRIEPPGQTLSIDAAHRAAFVRGLSARREACRGCFCYWHCAGDCYTRAVPRQDPQEHQPYARCAVNQAITRGLLLRNIAAGEGVYTNPPNPFHTQ